MKKKIDPDNLAWKSEYSIGHYRTDSEHMKLFTLARKAFSISQKENSEDHLEELRGIVRSLYEYVGTHFKNEEKYMKSIDYPDLKRHRSIHKDMLDTLHSFVQTLNDLTLDEIQETLYEFIEKYFIQHIVDEDKRIDFWSKSLKRLRKSSGWKKYYKTGNKEMDEEHKEMFEILDKAFEEVEDDQRDQKIKDVLNDLYDYMKVHFKSEEHYMKDIEYPEYEEHKKLHNDIVKSCNELLGEINNMEASLFEKELAKMIDIHIINHILEEDKKIIHWYNVNKK